MNALALVLDARKGADRHAAKRDQLAGSRGSVGGASQMDGRRVAARRVAQFAGRAAIDAVPDGEEHVVLLLHRKSVVEGCEQPARIAKIDIRQSRRTQHIDDRNRQQGCADAVPADIKQVERHVVVVDRVIAERVAAEFSRRYQQPFGNGRGGPRFREDRHHVASRIGKLGLQSRLCGLKRKVTLGQLVFDRLAMLDHGFVEKLQILILRA